MNVGADILLFTFPCWKPFHKPGGWGGGGASHKAEQTIKGIFTSGTKWTQDKVHQQNLKSTSLYCCKKENGCIDGVKAKLVRTKTTDVKWAEKSVNEGTFLLCYRTTGAARRQQVLSNLTRQSRLGGIEWHFAGRLKGSVQTVKIRQNLICLVYKKIIVSVSNCTWERKMWVFFPLDSLLMSIYIELKYTELWVKLVLLASMSMVRGHKV